MLEFIFEVTFETRLEIRLWLSKRQAKTLAEAEKALSLEFPGCKLKLLKENIVWRAS